MITDAEFQAWCEDSAALRTVLVEAVAEVDGVETTFYWATRGYTTEGVVSPVAYLGIVSTGVRFTEQISLDNEASLSAGDLELHNLDGGLDEYLTYIWTNRRVQAWIGDLRWPREDFRLIFDGIAAGMDSRGPDRLNLKLRDKLQRLNTPVTEVKLGAAAPGEAEDALAPLVFGQVHNMTPALIDEPTLEYRVHQAAVANVIEVRDNGKPVLFTSNLTNGTFILEDAPEGAITCSVQGDAPAGEYTDRIAPLIKRLVTGFGKVEDRFDDTEQLAPGYHPVQTLHAFSRPSPALYWDQFGVLRTAPADMVREDHDLTQPLGDGTYASLGYLLEVAAKNEIRNNVMQGAVVGTPGTLPTNWSIGGNAISGLTREIVGTGVEDGIDYIDIRLYGTVSVTSNPEVYITFEPGTATATATGDVWVSSYYARIAGGTTTGISGGENFIIAYRAAGSLTEANAAGFQYSTTALRENRIVHTRTLVHAESVTVQNRIDVNFFSNNPVVDFTLRIGLPQMEKNVLSTPIRNSGTITWRNSDVATAHKDIDLDSFAEFDAACPQPVGLPILDRMNVLEACRRLASSVGAQLLMSSLGKLRLFRIDLPPTGTTTHIYPEHMVGRKLRIAERTEVKAAVKLGFCQNHTVQKDLLTTIPAAHKELFAKEWLTETKEDATVKAKYRLHAEPPQQDTALLLRTDTSAEAQRRLNLWKVQRHVYEFEAYAALLPLQLGQAVTLHYPRFGLDAGVQGIVVMRAPDWDNARVKLGILI